MVSGAQALPSSSLPSGPATGGQSSGARDAFLQAVTADANAPVGTTVDKSAGRKQPQPKAAAQHGDAAREPAETTKDAKANKTAKVAALLSTGKAAKAGSSDEADGSDKIATEKGMDKASALPPVLLAALAAGAGSTSAAKSDLTKPPATGPAGTGTAPEFEAAQTAPAGAKSKTTRVNAAAARKDEASTSKDEPRADTKLKAETPPDTAARIADLRAVANPPAAADKAPIAPAMLGAGSSLTPSPAAPAEAQTSEVRVPLAQGTAGHALTVSPAMMVRVNTREGVTRSIEIRLDPPELGIVDVKLETGEDGRLTAILSTDRSDAFELLKRESGALEAALREAGVALEDGALSFSLNEGGTDPGPSGGDAYAGAARSSQAAIDEATQIEVGAWRDGLVDISV